MTLEIDQNNLPDNPEDLLKTFEQLESGAEPAATVQKEPDPVPAVEDKSQVNNDQPTTEQKAEQNDGDGIDGVATKDGKHVIPYSVLKSERDRAARAEQIAREATERVTALEAQLKSGNQEANNGDPARTNQHQPTVSDLSDEDMDTLKEDFPTVYKAVTAAMATAKALEAKLQPVEESVRNVEAERERTAAESVQEAIDAVPKLAHIQATNKDAFELAKQFDATLRTQASWANKPLSERFAKVAEMVESTIGTIEVPSNSMKPPTLDEKGLAKAAKAKAEQAVKSSNTNVPTSLSEFPAGHHVAQNEREAVDQMTHQQLAEKFSKMTPEEMDEYFKSL